MARDRLNMLGGNGDGPHRRPEPGHEYIPMDQFDNVPMTSDRHRGEQRGRSASNAGGNSRRHYEYGQGQGHKQGYRQGQGPAQGYGQDHSGGGTDVSLDSEFFNLFDKITAQVAELEADINTIKGMHNAVLVAVKGPQYTQESKRLQAFEDNLKRKIREIKSRLKQLDQYVQSSQDQDLTQSQAIQRKTRKQALTKRFADLIARYRQVESAFLRQQRGQLEREYRIAYPTATDEEVHQALESGANENIFQKEVVASRRHEAKRILGNVQERQRQMEDIAKSIDQLADMFEEVSAMVNQQQEQIDNIEAAVEATHINVEEGVKETEKAIVQRKKSRKKCWWIIGLVIILLVIIGVVLYLKLK